MQQYQVVVNGNTYTVTVKSIIRTTAVVDVDGLEFQVAITGGEDGIQTVRHVAAPVEIKAVSQKPSPPTPPAPKPKAPADGKPTQRASALEQTSPKPPSAAQISGKGVITAHLPGQIMEINVKVGDTVKKGDVVCKMEAMKMLNEVRSTVNGVVSKILVSIQQNVLENQPLMVID